MNIILTEFLVFKSFHPDNTKLKSATTVTYPSEFDWRNRHGQNWMTPIRLQGDVCGACCAFASVAVTEIMTNLYFNSHIDVDLSEQELISCEAAIDCGGSTNAVVGLQYIRDNSVVNEACFPYSASKDNCSNKCTSPNEKIGFSSISNLCRNCNENDIKNALIFKGPLASTICMGDWCHNMALVGYNVIQADDTIKRFDYSTRKWIDVIVQEGDPIIGNTYWIFKNSYLSGHAGYQYVFLYDTRVIIIIDGAINTPITSLNYSENDRVCVDNDHDGYYWWGIGAKPSNCPPCVPDTPDGDDSNPNLGPLDAYGNCIAITSPYTFPDHQITTTETWQSTSTECGNVIVKNGGNLTISGATINLEGNASFSVETGGILTFNSGTIQ